MQYHILHSDKNFCKEFLSLGTGQSCTNFLRIYSEALSEDLHRGPGTTNVAKEVQLRLDKLAVA